MLKRFLPSSKNLARPAFSLIELIVSVAIFVMIISVAIVSFRAFRQKHALDSSVREFQQQIQSARSLSLSGRSIDVDEVPAGGYGLVIDLDESTTSYQLFADRCCDLNDQTTSGDGLFDSGRGGVNADVESSGSPITLAADVSVQGIVVEYDPDGPSGPALPRTEPDIRGLSMTFIPPSATTTITFLLGGEPLTLGSSDSAQISLRHATSGQQRTIVVSPGAVGTVQIL